MLKNWGTWLGIESENGQVKEEKESAVDAKEENKPTNVCEEEQVPPKDIQLLQKAKGFSGYMYNFANTASKKLSESVVVTAQTLKKSVEEGKLNEIIDKTILGDFHKEQEKFVQEKKEKELGAAVPPWVGYNEEDTIQEQILALSADKRNFLRDPPAGVDFHFDFEQMYPVAMVMLEEDELLRKMRFHLVPKQVKEEIFWKNYFYRVSLIKQAAQLSALATTAEASHQKDTIQHQSSPALNISSSSVEDKEPISTSPLVAEFVSDTFDSSEINDDDLRKGMDQLVLNQKDPPNLQKEETADWEKELQEELQEYEVLNDNGNHDDNWDREIEEMLKEES
ncbi:unnamed protein product [Menidia menidia]|uniref:Synapse-associated protein 1 n=1 Tax=Menidia menidia TaxID=238744 RepID=A0A8S4A9F4_9TELE|nr:unnamed protein product [Menidia menidia]